MRAGRVRQIAAIAVAAATVLGAPARGETSRDLVAERPLPASTEGPGPLNISLVPTASVLRIGSPIGFSIGTTADGYVSLYALSVSGKVQLWLENVPVRAGQTISYPAVGTRLRAALPAGDEQVLMVVTRTPFAGFAPGPVRMPLVLPYTHHAFRQALDRRIGRIAPTDRASTELTVRIEDR